MILKFIRYKIDDENNLNAIMTLFLGSNVTSSSSKLLVSLTSSGLYMFLFSIIITVNNVLLWPAIYNMQFTIEY